MKIRTIASAALVSLAVTGISTTAEATVTYSDKGTVSLYELVEAQYTSDRTRVLVLSNDSSNAVLQKINPSTKTATATLEFTAPNTDGTHAWSDAVDMAVAADSSFAYVVFNDSDFVLAKVDLSTMEVVDYVSLGGIVNSSTVVQAVSLQASDAIVRIIGNLGSRTFLTDSLEFDPDRGNSSINLDSGVTNLSFAFDSVNSVYAYVRPDYNGLYSTLTGFTITPSSVSSPAKLSALALETDGGMLYAGNDNSGTDSLYRVNNYLSPMSNPTYKYFPLPSTVDGVRQIVVSDNAEQLVALSKDKKLVRVPLGRGWFAGLIDVISVADSGATLGSDPLIAISPDGSTVTYLDENDNVINFTLANNAPTVAQPVELAWYVSSKTVADLAWSISPDLGDSPLVSYAVQCTNGKSNAFQTIQTNPDGDRDTLITRNKSKTIKCRVIVTNEVGDSAPSNVVKVTAKGKRGPSIGG